MYFRYTQLCHAIIREQAVDEVQFARDFLPSLIAMVNDTVPNVRITLAKSMTCYRMNEGTPFYFVGWFVVRDQSADILSLTLCLP